MAISDINSVVLVGRLTRDAELKYASTGNAILSISIAVNYSKKEGEQWISEANYFDVSYFGKPAEAVAKYLTKGKQIAVQGALKQNRWEKDGQKFSRVVIQASSLELLSSSQGTGGGYSGGSQDAFGGYQQRPSYNMNQSSSQSDYMPQETFGGDNSEFPEDIPF